MKQQSAFNTKQWVHIGTYRTISDVEEDLLSLLGTADDVREAGSLLGCHTVMGKTALESCSFYT